MGYVLVTPPAAEPISLAEIKAHCRVDYDEADAYLESLIFAARQYVEREMKRSLMPQTWRLDLDGFPGGYGYPILFSGGVRYNTFATDIIRLFHGPVTAVSSIVYRDEANAVQTLDPSLYIAELGVDVPRVIPAVDQIWPFFQPQPGAVKITYTAGYADRASVPQTFKLAMFLLISHWFSNREAVEVGPRAAALPVPMGVDALLDNIPILA